MADIIVPVHELKSKLSEYLSRAVHGSDRILVSRHDKPIAMLAALNAEEQEPPYKNSGLESVDWDEFTELGEALDRIYENRQQEEYREVPL